MPPPPPRFCRALLGDGVCRRLVTNVPDFFLFVLSQGRFKLKQKDAVVNNKQASWQAFQTKGAKKKAKGSMAAVSLKKKSIFASPEGLEGKVGVTGSGQGITEQTARKKFKTIK